MQLHLNRCLLLSTTMAALLFPAWLSAQPAECESVNLRVRTVVKNGVQQASVNFSPAGQLDPTPILQTQIQTFVKTCVVVSFSAQADPLDNFIVFQASIDNVPMSGQAQFPYLTPAPATPVVFDPEETNLNASRMLSYTFVATLGPGVHTVRIKFAGCCSAVVPVPVLNSAIVRNAVMTVSF